MTNTKKKKTTKKMKKTKKKEENEDVDEEEDDEEEMVEIENPPRYFLFSTMKEWALIFSVWDHAESKFILWHLSIKDEIL